MHPRVFSVLDAGYDTLWTTVSRRAARTSLVVYDGSGIDKFINEIASPPAI